ncbi:PGN_0703 family putative restriction endonuclease [Prevotella pectinovora]|uniref:PGN_0703 family putative restriction endonuclease n=2 Tax=Prevotella pectinovora TaxID=1602169 RepID=UPI000A9098A4|nr:hypothetical protein [Prevotella pectinovora]
MERLLEILRNSSSKVWVLNSRYCPQMSDGNAVVHFTEKKVEGALPYATRAICEIKKYNKATFKEAYDIERNEKYNIHSKDDSRINAIWKFNKDVKTGDVMLYVSGSLVLGYYIVTGTESETTPKEGYCINSWKAETVKFKTSILINGVFGNPFFKEVGKNKSKVIEALTKATGKKIVNKNKKDNSRTFKEIQKIRQIIFRERLTKKGFTYILDDSEREMNLYNWQDKDCIQRVKDYFEKNKIKWWTCYFDAPEGQKADGKHISCNLLSSQIACINHLFFIRNDKNAVLSIINGIKGMPAKFVDVLNIPCDKGENNYISFEVIASKDYLHEIYLKRGELCTSVDALVYAVDENGERWLIPIEWKYTETYEVEDKSIEDNPKKESGNEAKGKTRLSRYCNIEGDNLIGNSKQLKSLPGYKHSIYFQEPFYQLMRQTLWAECICNSKDEQVLPAERFIHIHVCPKANVELLNKHYATVTDKPTMEEAWREMLNDQSLYHLIDPCDLMKPISDIYHELYSYLQKRYW